MVIVTAQTACTIYWSLVTDSLSLYKHLKNLLVEIKLFLDSYAIAVGCGMWVVV